MKKTRKSVYKLSWVWLASLTVLALTGVACSRAGNPAGEIPNQANRTTQPATNETALSPVSYWTTVRGTEITTDNVIAITNQARAKAGLGLLSVNDKLMTGASDKAKDMATRDYFDHATPDGYRMAYWLSRAGYRYTLAGENLARGFVDINQLQSKWMASPSHKKNITEVSFTEIGVGIAWGRHNGEDLMYVVVYFGAIK